MVRCKNCGQENDIDASFCEKCGANLLDVQGKPAKEGMKQSTKILITVCILLIAALGVTGAALLQMNKQPPQNPINNTNTTVNSSSANQTNDQQSNQTEIISASQAMAIANKYAAKFDEKAVGTDYINGVGDYYGKDGDPYYHVELGWITPHHYGNSDDIPPSWYVEIDAKTGKINPRG